MMRPETIAETIDVAHAERRRPPAGPRTRNRCGDHDQKGDTPKPAGVNNAERHELARSVARPNERAQFISVDDDGRKQADGYVDVAEAVASGRSFLVTLASNRLGIDADTDEQIDTLKGFARELRAAGIVPVLVQSGRGQHLFAAVRRWDRPAWMARARELGLDARDDIRPPLSPHPNGLEVRLLGCDVSAALAALSDTPEGGGLLSPKVTNLIQGKGTDPYRSSSEAVQAIATGCYAQSWTRHEFLSEMERSPVWSTIVEKHGGRSWLERSWRSARRHVEERRRLERAEVATCRAAVALDDWSGRSGPTDLAVLKAHLAVARWGGRIRHLFPVDDAAIEVGVSNTTVCKSRKRLVKRGWLIQHKKGGGVEATVWGLTIPTRLQKLTPTFTPPSTTECGRTLLQVHDDVGHDAFRWGALGKRGFEIVGVLEHADRPLTGVAIAGSCATNPHPTTVMRLIRRAHDAGLVEEAPTGGWRLAYSEGDELQRVAVDAGTAGKRTEQTLRVQQRRAARNADRQQWVVDQHHQHLGRIAPYFPVPGQPGKMLCKETGEIIDRPTPNREDLNGEAGWQSDTTMPESYWSNDHVGDLTG